MTTEFQGTFKALADPTRRAILVYLRSGDMTIGEVVTKFDITRAAVKKHLTILEQGHLISVHQRGRERINHLELDGLLPVSDWISRFDEYWDERLAALQSAIERKEDEHDT
ncbi:MAG: ArsR/SmtB family transcription factor [Hyphomicrobiaceae bacterium]